MNDPKAIEASILAICDRTPTESLADIMSQVDAVVATGKRLREFLEMKMVERMQESKADIVIGTCRFYIGDKKDVKCRDAAKALDKVLEVAAGDMQQAAACLSANAFKHGACRVMFEDAGRLDLFDELFETTYTPELKEGKPKLMKANLAFAK